LISSESVALTELIKNAYDADATKVMVRFSGELERGSGTIEVLDDGHGMSLETIKSSWMEPATIHRKRDVFSERFKRRVLGAKGIGRFASARLANLLQVVTRRQGDSLEINVIFDWGQFDDDDKYLDQIQIVWDQERPSEILSSGTIGILWEVQGQAPPFDVGHGTILRMEGLRVAWDKDRLEDLRAKLSRLIPPFEAARGLDAADFQIWLDLPSRFASLSGRVEPPEVIRNPHYNLTGHVDGDGVFHLTIIFRGTSESQEIRGKINARTAVDKGCGPFDIELRVWDRDQASLAGLAEESSSTVRELRDDLDRSAGISIYRDGFRVLPYGDAHNDWLRLDLRRVQNPTLRLSNNQVLGYVIISSEQNPELRDQSNREGLIEGSAFDDLREKIVGVLSQIETRRWSLRRAMEPSGTRRASVQGIFVGFDLEALRAHVTSRYPSDSVLLALLRDKQQDLEARVTEVQQVISRYRRLATMGQLVDIVLHEGRTPVAGIANEVALALRKLRGRKELTGEQISSIRSHLTFIVTQTEALRTLFKRIEPFGGRQRGRPKAVVIEDVVREAMQLFQTEINRLGVRVKYPDTSTTAMADSSEIQEIIVNLLQNSLYWLERKPQSRREIAIQVGVRPSGDSVEILFSDSGPGVDPEFRQLIFEPYFSTKPHGVGLGLAIAGEIVSDYYSGQLELVDSGLLDGANFRIVLKDRT
jgi:signal transduction histidine kinase